MKLMTAIVGTMMLLLISVSCHRAKPLPAPGVCLASFGVFERRPLARSVYTNKLNCDGKVVVSWIKPDGAVAETAFDPSKVVIYDCTDTPTVEFVWMEGWKEKGECAYGEDLNKYLTSVKWRPPVCCYMTEYDGWEDVFRHVIVRQPRATAKEEQGFSPCSTPTDTSKK